MWHLSLTLSLSLCVCVCVCACTRARICVFAWVCVLAVCENILAPKINTIQRRLTRERPVMYTLQYMILVYVYRVLRALSTWGDSLSCISQRVIWGPSLNHSEVYQKHVMSHMGISVSERLQRSRGTRWLQNLFISAYLIWTRYVYNCGCFYCNYVSIHICNVYTTSILPLYYLYIISILSLYYLYIISILSTLLSAQEYKGRNTNLVNIYLEKRFFVLRCIMSENSWSHGLCVCVCVCACVCMSVCLSVCLSRV